MGAAQSGSPTQDGQGKKVLKFRWQPKMAVMVDLLYGKKKLITTIQVKFVLIPCEAGMRTQINLNCCFCHTLTITAISWPPPAFSPWPSCVRLPDWAAPFFYSLNGCF